MVEKQVLVVFLEIKTLHFYAVAKGCPQLLRHKLSWASHET